MVATGWFLVLPRSWYVIGRSYLPMSLNIGVSLGCHGFRVNSETVIVNHQPGWRQLQAITPVNGSQRQRLVQWN